MAILQLKQHRKPLLWVPKLEFLGIFDLQKQKLALLWPVLQTMSSLALCKLQNIFFEQMAPLRS